MEYAIEVLKERIKLFTYEIKHENEDSVRFNRPLWSAMVAEYKKRIDSLEKAIMELEKIK